MAQVSQRSTPLLRPVEAAMGFLLNCHPNLNSPSWPHDVHGRRRIIRLHTPLSYCTHYTLGLGHAPPRQWIELQGSMMLARMPRHPECATTSHWMMAESLAPCDSGISLAHRLMVSRSPAEVLNSSSACALHDAIPSPWTPKVSEQVVLRGVLCTATWCEWGISCASM